MAIKTVIIDDQPNNILMLEEAIDEIFDVEVIATFSSGEEFFKVFKKLRFELCIIDYHLPGINGVECVKKLADKKIILTSPEVIPADEAMDLEDVIDVIKITRPIQKERLTRAIKKVRDELLNERGFVVINSYPNNIRQLLISDIVYITTYTADPRVKIVHTKTEQIRTQKYTIERILEKLPDRNFCRINKSDIINIDFFHSYKETDVILLHNSQNVPKPIELTLSDNFFSTFADKLGLDSTEK